MDGVWRFLAGSISTPLFWENSPWMEGHDLDEPRDWYPAVAARSRRCLVSTSIAKQPEREIRPVISVSLSLFAPFSVISLSLWPSSSLALLCSLFNFHWKPRTTGIIRTKEILNVIPVESRISGAKSSGHSVHSNAEYIECRLNPNASCISPL